MKANETLGFLTSKCLQKSPYMKGWAQRTFPLIHYHTDTCIAFARALDHLKGSCTSTGDMRRRKRREKRHQETSTSPCAAQCRCLPFLPTGPIPCGHHGCQLQAGCLLLLTTAAGDQHHQWNNTTRITPLGAMPAKSCQGGNLNYVWTSAQGEWLRLLPPVHQNPESIPELPILA